MLWRTATSPRSVRRPRSFRSAFALAGAAFVGALAVAELAVRAVIPEHKWLRGYREQAAAMAGALRPDAELGHVPVLGGKTHDGHGLLYGESITHAADDGVRPYRVLFLGDSVTARGKIVAPLRRLWRGGPCEFLNAGLEASNPVQTVALYVRHQRALSPDHVVLSLHNNDFTSTRVCLQDDDGSLVLCTQGAALRLHAGLYDACALYRLWVAVRCPSLNKGDDYLHKAGAVEASLRTLRDDVAARGARLTVLLLPIFFPLERWQPHEHAAREHALRALHELGIPFVDLLAPTQELIAAGVDVLQTPGDSWHPGDECGAHLAAAAVRAGLFAEAGAVPAAAAPAK